MKKILTMLFIIGVTFTIYYRDVSNFGNTYFVEDKIVTKTVITEEEAVWRDYGIYIFPKKGEWYLLLPWSSIIKIERHKDEL